MKPVSLRFVTQLVIVSLISAEISIVLYNILTEILPISIVHILIALILTILIPLLTRNLWHGIGLLSDGLERLNRINSAEALPTTRAAFPFQPLLHQLNHLGGHGRDIAQLRGAFAQQIAEAAAQEERNRLARDLHDSIKQQIFSMKIGAATAEARFYSDPDGAQNALTHLQRSAADAMDEMDNLLRQLRPAPIDKLGLVEAIREQCVALNLRSGADVAFDAAELPNDNQFEVGSQGQIYRIIQEALSNIARHARATQVAVTLAVQTVDQRPYLNISIRDNGQGFDPATTEQGMGLHNIQARAEQLGGQFELLSHSQGTTIRVKQIPLLTTAPSAVGVTLATAQARLQRLETLHGRWLAGWTILSWLILQLNWLGLFRTGAKEALLRFGVWGIGLVANTAWVLAQTNQLQQRINRENGTLLATEKSLRAFANKYQSFAILEIAFFGAFFIYWLAQLTVTPWAYEYNFALGGLIFGAMLLFGAAGCWFSTLNHEKALFNTPQGKLLLEAQWRSSIWAIVGVTALIIGWSFILPTIRTTMSRNILDARWFEWLNLTLIPTLCTFWLLHLARAVQLMRWGSADV